jgi:HSP20 family protein
MAICKASSSLHVVQHLGKAVGDVAMGETGWTPNTDVYQTEGRLTVKVELAGLRREDLELAFDGNRLTISGQRIDCCRAPHAKCRFLVMEINYGAFQSMIEVPKGFDSHRYPGKPGEHQDPECPHSSRRLS